ncbi:MAG: kynureninase, partial [Planctomycetes bacterium]|nr:kynureninase [Planctomycetota bacterium]
MTRDTVSSGASIDGFQPDEDFARQCDAEDPLRGYRDRFCIPRRADGSEVIYLAGNSLGLEPKGVRAAIEQELADWADMGVDAHFNGKTPWYSYHQVFRESGARLVGALPGEVVMMNSLTVNLHLMMVTFYQPTPQRYKVLMDSPAFPSDTYAVKTHLRHRGYDAADALILAQPRGDEHTIREDDLVALLDQGGREIALVLLGGVNFFTGQVFDMARIAAAAQRRGCMVGLDLAHAAGNLPLHLHDWNIDFAVWCNYKYLNSGPGAVGGCFIHERHARNIDLTRFGGWWGNDPDTRFLMHLQPDFVPRGDADGWQISNPPILAMAPMKVSIDLFEEVGMTALRSKSM